MLAISIQIEFIQSDSLPSELHLFRNYFFACAMGHLKYLAALGLTFVGSEHHRPLRCRAHTLNVAGTEPLSSVQ
jgi:hypothetical protein